MRPFANLFLLLFLADGCISLLDELLSIVAPVPFLSEARGLLAGSVIVLAVFVYISLGIDRRLPKKVFLPLTLFVLCSPLAPWVFPALAGNRAFGPLAAACQVALVMVPFSSLRKGGRGCLKVPEELFDAPLFGLKNTLVYAAVNLVLVPLALAILLFHGTNTWMAGNTAGFMRLAPDGLHMTERIYRRGDRTVRLHGMIHVGEKDYYEGLAGVAAAGRTIVLAEGVTDERKLLHSWIDYGKVAGFLGLTSQERMHFRGRVIGPEALDAPPLPSMGAGEKGKAALPDILRADVDLSSFRPQTIFFLNSVGKLMQDSGSPAEGLLAVNAWAGRNFTREMHDTVMDDILHRRNMEVIRHLEKALKRYDTVIIPWGAMHMKGIEEEVLRRGFDLREEREKVSIDFRRFLPGSL